MDVRFDWNDYYDLSCDLLENYPTGLSDAAYRCAVSRAYYAVFGLAREHAEHHDKLTLHQKGSDHRRVHTHFRESADKTRHQIGLNIERLLAQRRTADYDAATSITKKTAELSLAEAEATLRLLKKLGPRT